MIPRIRALPGTTGSRERHFHWVGVFSKAKRGWDDFVCFDSIDRGVVALKPVEICCVGFVFSGVRDPDIGLCISRVCALGSFGSKKLASGGWEVGRGVITYLYTHLITNLSAKIEEPDTV
jgi:hypothetical protein